MTTDTTSITTVECLPEEIIQHIQSILRLRDASRSRLLSKPWLCDWSTIPTLRFQQPPRMSAEFIKLVDDTLKRYQRNNLLIEKFDLLMVFWDFVLDSWLHILASKSNGIKELHLRLVMNFYPDRSYQFPSGFLPSRTLEKLTLRTWYKPAKLVISCDDIMKSHSLDTVHLQNVHIEDCFRPANSYDIYDDDHGCQNLKYLSFISVTIDDVLFNKLLSKLPSLEKLYLSSCRGLEMIGIDCVSLKDLTVSACRELMEVKICTPKLACLHFTGSRSTSFSFSTDTPTQLRTVVELFYGWSKNPLFFVWLREFLIRSQHFKIYAHDQLLVDDDDLQDMREVLQPLGNFLEIEYFEINLLKADIFEFMDVDALFSFCHPNYVILHTWFTPDALNAIFTKLFSKKLGEQTYLECCISPGQIKCWRHYLKDVEFGFTRISWERDSWDLPAKWTSVLEEPMNSLKLTWYESIN